MATRIYLPNTGAAPISPTLGTYTETTGADRIKAVTSRISSAMTSKVQAHTAIAANSTFLSRQYVIGPLAGQTYGASTIKGTIRVLESAANDNLDAMRLAVRVVASDGTTFRSPNIYGQTNSTVAEFNTALRAKRLATGGATSSVTITEGDYLVIEIATTSTVGGTSLSDTISYGDDSATDLGDNETDLTALNPFIELAANIKFLQKGYGQAQADIKAIGNGLGQSQADIKTQNRGFGQAQAAIQKYAYLQDTFTRTVSDGWGVADSGAVWIINGDTISALYATNGTGGTHTVDGNDAGTQVNVDAYNFDVTLKWAFDDRSTLPGVWVSGRTDDVELLVRTDPTGELDLTFFSVQGSLGGSVLSSYTYVNNDQYYVRFRVISTSSNTSYYGKIWKVGDTEPDWATTAVIATVHNSTHRKFSIQTTRAVGTVVATYDDINLVQAYFQGFGQAQAKIAERSGCGQANADVKAVGNGLGQAQADVKVKSWGFGQAQTDIKRANRGLAQATVFIDTGIYTMTDTFTRTVANGFGTADSGIDWTTYTSFANQALNANLFSVNGAAAEINADVVISHYFIPRRLLFTGAREILYRFKISVFPSSVFDIDTSFGTGEKSSIFPLNGIGILNGTNELYISTENGITAQLVATTGQYYWVKFHILPNSHETYVKAKVWIDGGTEPGWLKEDSSPVYNPERIIFKFSQDGLPPQQLTFDDLSISAAAPSGSGQVQALIQKIGQGFGQAQADIKAVGNGSGQTQADILATSSGFGQSQADIKATSNGFGQAQSDIKAVGNGFGQAQADIKATNNGFGQSQADIKAVGSGFGQALALIPNWFSAQNAAVITTNQYTIIDTFTRTVSGSLGTPDVGPTWVETALRSTLNVDGSKAVIVGTGFNILPINRSITPTRQYQGKIRIRWSDLTSQISLFVSTMDDPLILRKTGLSVTEDSGSANLFAGVAGQSAFTSITILSNTWYNLETQANTADRNKVVVKAKIWADGDPDPGWIVIRDSAPATNRENVSFSGPSIVGSSVSSITVDIDDVVFSPIGWTESGQAQAKITAAGATTVSACGQAQADIKQTYSQVAQSQADIKAVENGLGQSQADILATNTGFGQAQSDIKATGNGLGQAQSDIKATSNGFGQAQTDIQATQSGLGQANADIKAVANGSGQAQSDIKTTYATFGQAQADIRATGYGLGQANADIKATLQGCGQAQADVRAVSSVYSQAQADIAATYQQYGQAQSDIKAVGYGSGQSQAAIKGVNYGNGQAQADILASGYGLGQAQTDIQVVQATFAQAEADIRQTYSQVAQAQADILAVGYGAGQANADIKATGYGSGQTQADILSTGYGSGQAQTYIQTSNSAFGQAQTDIRSTYQGYGQAQAYIYIPQHARAVADDNNDAWVRVVI